MREADFDAAIQSVRSAIPHVRFPVYRNNVASALVSALAVRFPVVRALVGDEFFRAMAALFAEDNKPRTPVLIHYGDEFAGFIATFEPARQVAYLADVARLENLWWRAYHARDEKSVDASILSRFPQEALPDLRFQVHASAGVMSAGFAVSKIWHAHHGGPAMGSFAVAGTEHVIVSRPGDDVELLPAGAGMAAFVSSLMAETTFVDAVSAASGQDADFDIASSLAHLFNAQLITGIIQ